MSSFRRSLVSYSGAMLYCRVAAVVQGLLVMRWMGPEALGPWFALQLITTYGEHAHLGLLNAVNRQVPFHRGRKELERAERVERVARGALLALMALGLVVVAGMLLAGVQDGLYGRGVVALTLVAVLALGFQFHVGLFRARRQFGLAGWGSVVNATAIVLGLPLVYAMHFDGLLWRAVAVATVSLIATVAMNGWDLRAEYDWKETLRLVRIGAPIMVVVLVLSAFASMDRVLILLRLDSEAMGLYGLCFTIARVMKLVPNTIGQLYYPRMTESYAAGGLSTGLLRLCRNASLLSGVAALSVAVPAVLLLPWAVEWWFPRYAPGLPALRIAMIAYVILALAAGPTYFLIASVQKRRQMMAAGLGVVTMVAAAYLAAPARLESIAWSLVAGSAVYIGGLWAIVVRSTRRTGGATV